MKVANVSPQANHNQAWVLLTFPHHWAYSNDPNPADQLLWKLIKPILYILLPLF
jgi:hypothetical protein